jgi:methylated-DNA-[protein]-cysteine S-methyltransferase
VTGQNEQSRYTQVATPVGTLTLVASDTGLRHILWPGEKPPDGAAAARDPLLARAVAQLNAYFSGELRAFDLPLDLSGTEFQLTAWRGLALIPYGTTVSYATQAVRIGHSGAARAVGAANGRNPVPIVLACHRVVGARGHLTGFGGGIAVKRALIDHEARSLSV